MKSGRVQFHEGAKAHSHKGMTRRKGTRRGIKTTVITPKWMRDLRAGWRGFRRNAWNLLAGLGLFWLVWQVMLWLAARAGGG